MSGISLGQSGGQKSARPFVGVGGVWKPAAAMFVGQGGAWKPVYSARPPPPGPLTATLYPTYADWWYDGTTLVAGPFGCGVTGGVPPYSYNWIGGDPVDPTGASTIFRSLSHFSQAFFCIVVDATGAETGVGGEIG